MILSHCSTRFLRLLVSFTNSINLRHRSLCLSIYLPQSATFSLTINGSISQSIDDPFPLFNAISSPVIHELDQSKGSIPLSINLSCDLSHSLSRSMAKSVSPSMILSHYSTRTLRLSFTTWINLRNRSLYLSIYHVIYHILSHDQWLNQSVPQ